MTIKSNSEPAELLRSIEHQSVPLSLDVIVFRLLSDVDAVKLQLPGQLLLSFEDNKRDLEEGNGTGESYEYTLKKKKVKGQRSSTLRQL